MIKIIDERRDGMKKNIIGYCPICHDKLVVKTLRCNHCDTEITGDFVLNPFDYLSKEQLDFALVFIKNQGNIKDMIIYLKNHLLLQVFHLWIYAYPYYYHLNMIIIKL